MIIAMTGSTGFVGGHLSGAFTEKGWKVVPVWKEDFSLDPAVLAKKIAGAGCVVNLAGAPVAAKWSDEYKKILRSSRIDTTRKIVQAMQETGTKPSLFISASAVGIYASHDVQTEKKCVYADDFLGTLARDWEREALQALNKGIRTVIFRFGVVLGRDGGALQKMIPPFRLGFGGKLGDGTQAFSWIHIDDLVSAFLSVIANKDMEGIYNLTAPHPTTNAGLTFALSHALGKPAFLTVPPFVLRMKFGEGADILLKGQQVLPSRLLDGGFRFRFGTIEDALSDILGRSEKQKKQ